MEDIPRNIGKDITRIPRTTSTTRKKRWTLLFVEDYGRVLSLGNVKGWMITLILVLVVGIIAMGLLYYMNRNMMKRNAYLRNALSEVRQQVLPLKDENDLLMARLVVTEAKLESIYAKEEAQQPEAPETPEETVPSSKTTVEEAPLEAPAFVQPEKPKSVEVEQFHVYYDPELKNMLVEFKLVNILQEPQPVSGYTFVVFKRDQLDQSDWLALPRVNLISGMPSPIHKGRYFVISRFNIIRFKSKLEFDPEYYKQALVFVFNKSGKLLLEKNFPVTTEKTDL